MIATREFLSLADHERKGLGMPSMPMALITHPLGDLTLDRLAARADQALDQIIHALTAPAEQVAAEERQRDCS